MPDEINANGLTVKTLAEIRAELEAGMRAIYGADINLDSDSPDGQFIGIIAQALFDTRRLLVSIWNSFSVPNSQGTYLDKRVALQGMVRKSGTYTTTPVAVTVDRAVTLYGLNQTAQAVFTYADENGNEWELLTTQVIAVAGTASYTFRAKNIGVVTVIANSITVPVTVVLGVTAVNNPDTTGTVPGTNEESDASLKVRQAKSFTLQAIDPADTVEAALLNVANVTDAYVVENFTGAEVAGVPAHTIWAIVEGGADVDIGEAIYAKKGPGCGMKGSSSYVVTRPNGSTFTALWDVALTQPLYMTLSILWVGGVVYDNPVIATMLADYFTAHPYRLGQNPTIGDIAVALRSFAPTAVLVNPGVSDEAANYESIIYPDSAAYKFTVAAANILIV